MCESLVVSFFRISSISNSNTPTRSPFKKTLSAQIVSKTDSTVQTSKSEYACAKKLKPPNHGIKLYPIILYHYSILYEKKFLFFKSYFLV